jgi:hypothetical protein
MLDSSGFPKSSQVFAGNANEPKTLKKRINGLEKKSGPSTLYQIDVLKDGKSGNALKIRFIRTVEPDTKDVFPGVCCLRTSHKDLNEDAL